MSRGEGKRLALIVANDTYEDPKLPPLGAPLKDAERLAKVLEDPAIGGFKTEFLPNAPRHVLEEKLGDFFGDRERDDFLLVHFACHGVRDEDNILYLAAPNTRWGKFETTAVSTEKVIRLTEKSGSKRIVLLLDCCYSGAFAAGLRPRSGESVEIAQRFAERLGSPATDARDLEEDGHGIAVLTAAQAVERAWEGHDLADEQPSSFFTGALVRGLESGHADLDHDGKVSIGDLYEYVDRHVREQTPNQHPGFWIYRGRGRLNVARASRAPAARRDYSRLEPRLVLADTDDELFSVAISPGGNAVAAGTDGGVLVWRNDVEVRRWSEDTRPSPKLLVQEAETFVYAVAFSPGAGHLVASAAEDGNVRFTDVATENTRTLPREHAEAVYSVDFSPDGSRLVSGGYDGQVIVWDVETGRPQRRTARGRRVSSVAFSPRKDEQVVAIGRLDNSVSVWDLSKSSPPAEIGRHHSSVEGVAFSHDGALLATCGLDKGVRVWDIRERAQLWENTEEHEYLVRSVAFSPNGTTVVSASWDKTIKLWDAGQGVPSELSWHENRKHTDWIWSVAFSHDGLALVSAGSDGRVIVWTFPE